MLHEREGIQLSESYVTTSTDDFAHCKAPDIPQTRRIYTSMSSRVGRITPAQNAPKENTAEYRHKITDVHRHYGQHTVKGISSVVER